MSLLAKRVQPYRVIRCWACEELTTLISGDGRCLIEADAETVLDSVELAISCPCGARTITSGNWEVDER